MQFNITAHEEIMCGSIMVADMHEESTAFELVRRANAYDELRDALERALTWLADEADDPDVVSARHYFDGVLARNP